MIGTQIRIVGWNGVINVYDIYLYYMQTFLLPSGILFGGFVLFCIDSFLLASFIVKRFVRIVHILIYIVILVVIGGISFLAVTNLANGGGALSQEKETDAITTYGYVESIYSPSRYILLWVTGEKSRGADIVIDGVRYFIASTKDFEEGDYVAISYLPNSHFILQMVDVSGKDETKIKEVLNTLSVSKTGLQARRTLLQRLWEHRIYIVFFLWFIFCVVLNLLDPLSLHGRKF